MGFKLFEDGEDITSIIQQKYTQVVVSQLAIRKAINMIAHAIAKAEIKVYRLNNGKIKETVDGIYWMLNIMPNPNETGTDFWIKVINTLFTRRTCLIVNNSTGMYVADSFTESTDVLKGKTYTNVVVSSGDDSVQLKTRFKSENVILLKLNNNSIQDCLDRLNANVDELVSVSMDAYKRSRVSKWQLNMPSTSVALKDKDGKIITSNEYAKRIKETLSTDELEVLLSGSGIDVKELDTKIASNQGDTQALVDSVYKNTALAFDIPYKAFVGDITEQSDATNEFITFSCSWIKEMLDDSFNAKYVGQESYIKGERMFVDLSNFKHIDVIDSANNLDKLYADGWSHNDIRKLCGLPPVDEEWANEHHTTKNYADVEKGGEGK